MMREISNEEDTAHLEQQEHPGDAEADKGALSKAGQPNQTKSQDSNQKGRWVSKGFEA